MTNDDKETFRTLLLMIISAIIVLTGFVLYYNAHPPKIVLIDAEHVLSDADMNNIQRRLQIYFHIPIEIDRAPALPVELALDPQTNRYDADKVFDAEGLDTPGFNEYRIYYSNKDFTRGKDAESYVASADYRKRIAILALHDLPQDEKLKTRTYKLTLRMIGRFFGRGQDERCGVMAEDDGSDWLSWLDGLDTHFCGEDKKWLESVKYIRKVTILPKQDAPVSPTPAP